MSLVDEEEVYVQPLPSEVEKGQPFSIGPAIEENTYSSDNIHSRVHPFILILDHPIRFDSRP